MTDQSIPSASSSSSKRSSSLTSHRSPRLRPSLPNRIPSKAAPLVTIVVRFSQNQLPDLLFTIQYATKIRRLKFAIRQALPSSHSTSGLRLIHGGRLLEDEWSVAKALKLRSAARSDGSGVDRLRGVGGVGSSKGKERMVVDADNQEIEKVYVHCSVSTEPASPGILAREAAEDSEEEVESEGEIDGLLGSAEKGARNNARNTGEQTPTPIGFDRLLSGTTGFSQADIASLRAQFNNIIASRHTPDSMPSPTSLRRMEDRWLDTESFSTSRNAASVEADGGLARATDEEEDAAAAMYDGLYGVVCGFFWPLGALVWGFREEGVWSRRRGFAVLAGLGINLGFGLVRILS